MIFRLLWVGKTREEWVKSGVDEYTGRIRRYLPLEVTEVREEKGTEPDLMRAKEGERILKALPKGARVVLLDERGEEMTSPQFATFIEKTRDQGVPEISFLIGGAYGFSDDVRKAAYRTVSLSRMTFPHQVVRIFLAEQLYRALTIMNREGYHH